MVVQERSDCRGEPAKVAVVLAKSKTGDRADVPVGTLST